MTEQSGIFDHSFRFAGLVDMGKKRKTNQDEIICLPERGFFGVIDGMGGLTHGGKTARMIRRVMADIIADVFDELAEKPEPELAAALLTQQVGIISDSIFNTGNRDSNITFGATICGVLLVGGKAVFVNLGDSRGYHLPCGQKEMKQVTRDHNVAWLLLERGELTKSELKEHPASSRLTRFVGMAPPSAAESFIVGTAPGDRLLLCSDGIHGMVDEEIIREMISVNREPETICRDLINQANANGGRDNISAVYIEIK